MKKLHEKKAVIFGAYESVKQKRWFIKTRIRISGLHISQYIHSSPRSYWH